jgi:hypothetical protein
MQANDLMKSFACSLESPRLSSSFKLGAALLNAVAKVSGGIGCHVHSSYFAGLMKPYSSSS